MMCLFTEDLGVPFERRNKWPGQKSRGHGIAGAAGSAAGMLHRLGAHRTGSQVVKGLFCPSDGYQTATACVSRVTRSQLGGFSAHLHQACWKNQIQPTLPITSSFVANPRAVPPCPYLPTIDRSWCSLAGS